MMDLKPNVSVRRVAALDLSKRYGIWTEKIEQANRNIEIVVGDWDADDEVLKETIKLDRGALLVGGQFLLLYFD